MDIEYYRSIFEEEDEKEKLAQTFYDKFNSKMLEKDLSETLEGHFEGRSLRSQWVEVPQTIPPTFSLPKKAPLSFLDTNCNENDIFNYFLGEDFFSFLAEQTNESRKKYINKISKDPHSRLPNWKETDSKEIRRLFGMILWMGLVRLPSISDYWSNELLFTTAFDTVMTIDRFLLLMRFFQISERNNEHNDQKHSSTKNKDKRFDFLLSTFEKFRMCYIPSPCASFSEADSSFHKSPPTSQVAEKPEEQRTRLYALCDSSNGYCLHLAVKTGVWDPDAILEEAVQKAFTGSGRYVFSEKPGVSFEVMKRLKGKFEVGFSGVLEKGIKGLPETIFGREEGGNSRRVFVSKEGIIIGKCNGVMIGTTFDGFGREKIPSCVKNYQGNRSGVELMNTYCSVYRFPHKNKKSWRSLFVQILEIFLSNMYLHYTLLGKTSSSRKDFRVRIIKELLQLPASEIKEKEVIEKEIPKKILSPPKKEFLPTPTLSAFKRVNHNMVHVNSIYAKRCKNCKQHKSSFKCEGCSLIHGVEVTLCRGECWRDFHENPLRYRYRHVKVKD